MSRAPARVSQPPPARVVSVADSGFSSLFSTANLNTAFALLAAAAGGAAVAVALQSLSLGSSLSSPSSLPSRLSRRLTMSSKGSALQAPSFTKKPIVVTITGAAGQIGYSIIFMVAAGRMLGDDQPIELRLLDMSALHSSGSAERENDGGWEGVMMELDDCAFPLLTKVVGTADYREAFEGCEIALLIGARPRGPGMDRKDLLKANAAIFEGQGKALDQYASRQVKVLVVGNPANTNALITRHYAPSLPSTAFTAMTRLDQNRAQAQIAKRLGISVGRVKNIAVWGNHSNTQYPDISHASVLSDSGAAVPVSEAVGSAEYLQGDFIKVVQSRGAAIIDALKKSSAASAANAAVDHVRDWVLGTREGEWVSMAVISDGNPYGVEGGLCYSFPVTCKGGEWTIVDGLSVDAFSRAKLMATQEELVQERKDALGL